MRVKLLGIEIDNYNFSEAIDNAWHLMHLNKVSQVVTINPEMFAEAEKNTDFRQILQNAEMVFPDGVGVKLALKIKGINSSRIAGIDFAKSLLEMCAEQSVPVAIIGAKEDVIREAVIRLKNDMKTLNVVYYHNGYFNDDNEIYEQLRIHKPRLILVATGSPKQEIFIHNAKEKLNFGLMIGIGGSLDVWSGTVKRAPVLFQKFGLEWLYRTIKQPERLKRIFPALPLFLIKVLTYKEE